MVEPIRRKRKLTSFQVISLGFLGVILAGTLLLVGIRAVCDPA